jgi:YD repeat-containing protein
MEKVIRLTENDLSKIVKRVIIESVDYYDKIVSILELPYYQNLISMGIDEDHWGTIFSKLFNKPVRKDGVYFLDENGNRIYGENSHGFWIKYEYNDNGNEIYREDSENGVVFDHRNNNLNESTDDRYYDKIVNILEPPYFKNLRSIGIDEYQWETILSKLFNQTVRKDDKYLYDSNDNIIYREDSDGQWVKYEYDNNGNKTYHENSRGHWVRYEYDSNGNVVYYENSDGVWIKKEYDDNGNQIYYENSDGEIRDKRNNNNLNESTEDRYYDKIVSILEPPYFQNLESIGIDVDYWKDIFNKLYGERVYIDFNGNIRNKKGKVIYYEQSDGYWRKEEYDNNGNVIHYENSNGYWIKQEYDEKGKLIYIENPDGEILNLR